VLKSFVYEDSTATVGIKKTIFDSDNGIWVAVAIGEYRGEITVELPGLGEVRMPLFWLGEISPEGKEVVEGFFIGTPEHRVSVVEFGNVLYIEESQGLVDVDKIKGTVLYTGQSASEILDRFQEAGQALYAFHLIFEIVGYTADSPDCGSLCQQAFVGYEYNRALMDGEERDGYGVINSIFIPGHY